MKNNPAKKPPFWFYLILILIPLFLIVLLELALRIFNYGDDYSQWAEMTETKYVLNPDYTRKFFFATEEVPYSIGNVFDIEKKPNAFRVFILGGSSAAGFPYTPSGDFGKYLQKRLETLYPDNRIEVVNLAITATNSYTIRDLTKGIIEQKPDLIIIYAGHNEFYGALGAGSMESVGNNRTIVKFVIYMNDFKITQLLRNMIKWISGVFAPDSQKDKGGTLMARMAKEQLIPYKSDIYYSGIEQFRENIRDVLEQTKEAGIPVVLSTLASNLKDQPPFISAESENYQKASDVFNLAELAYNKGRTSEAESLFVLAKDLDALRFRAPSEINNILKEFSQEFNYPLADVYTELNKESTGRITGNDFMTDHLHPTLRGYQILGRCVFEVMEKNSILPEGRRLNVSDSDSIAVNKYYFTSLDSTIARYRIIILKNDWPFSESRTAAYILKQFQLSDAIDTLAVKVINEQLAWEEAHRMAAKIYLKMNDYFSFSREMLVLMDQFPFIEGYFNSTAETLIDNKQYDIALEVLHKKFRYSPDAFSAKWIGNIELSRSNDKDAVKYLTESLKYKGDDAQVLYNLSGAYTMSFQYDKALEMINRCIRIEPDFPGAKQLKSQLEAAAAAMK